MTRYVVIDFETTGLDPSHDYPIQLGWQIVEDNGRVAFTPESVPKAMYIAHPMTTVEYLASPAYKVHGIPVEAPDAKHPKEAYEVFVEDVTRLTIRGEHIIPVIAGHNVFFDFSFLKRLKDLAGVEGRFPFDYHLMDTATLGMFFYGVKALDSIVRLAGIDLNWHKRHDAGVDVGITAKLLLHLLKLKKQVLY